MGIRTAGTATTTITRVGPITKRTTRAARDGQGMTTAHMVTTTKTRALRAGQIMAAGAARAPGEAPTTPAEAGGSTREEAMDTIERTTLAQERTGRYSRR